MSGELPAGVGTAELAADADGAAVVVLLDGDRARLIDGAARPSRWTTIDPTRRFGRVRGDGEPLGRRGAVAGPRRRSPPSWSASASARWT